ncbi:DinB family protein [Maribacter sp. 2308TA10-17]|uniref:DinB family protein n=1 Tax=Maribacter sp. 2308TA10-17 TaxID=3386276 RepID=UPI0039BD5C3F
MRTQLEIIVQNLKDSFDGKPWYGISVMEKLNEIPWRIVNDKVYGEKSIAILVQHIMNWRIFVLKKLEGDLEFNIIIDGENDWDEVHVKSPEEWNFLKQKLQSTQDSLIQKLSQETDELLNKEVPGKDYLFGPILISIAQHDIYHLGQIAMLNSMKKG